MQNIKSKILIVDDELEICSLLASIIEFELPITPTLLKNGEEAIQALAKEKYDLIICDYSMPIKNGYNVLVSNQQRDNTPFIMLTGDYPEKYPELLAIKTIHPDNEVLTKPFYPDTVVEIVKNILKKNETKK